MTTEDDLASDIVRRVNALGLTAAHAPDGELVGRRTVLDARWPLGRRTIAYRMSCNLNATEGTLRFREAMVGRSCGLPPPARWWETTWIAGWRRSGRLAVSSTAGAGEIDYAAMRREIKAAAEAAGWTFVMEGGRLP